MCVSVCVFVELNNSNEHTIHAILGKCIYGFQFGHDSNMKCGEQHFIFFPFNSYFFIIQKKFHPFGALICIQLNICQYNDSFSSGRENEKINRCRKHRAKKYATPKKNNPVIAHFRRTSCNNHLELSQCVISYASAD